MKRLMRVTGLALLGLGLAFMMHGRTAAAADYNNSRLMDDVVFDNVGSMNEAQIQAFLASKGPCLVNFQDVDPNFDGTSWSYSGSVAASHVIYKTAQMWGLNPQVILATLQKEESLITGTSCDGWRYNSAMGYGCPDGGGCNPKYVGFTKQVLWGSWQLKFNKERSYGNTAWDGDGDIVYGGLMTQGARKRCDTCQTFNYDGNAVIDGQTIHLDNGPTASFYNYTPHLNQSLPGIFEGWFGSVRAPTYGWTLQSQTSSVGLNGILAGTTATFTVTALNSGGITWTNSGPNPVRLGTSWPNDRNSPFAANTWIAPSRPAVLNEASVAPGQVGTFTFTVKAPLVSANYHEHFSLLAEGLAWMNDPGMYFDISVAPLVYKWGLSSQAAYTSASKTTPVDLGKLSPGQTAWLVLRATNTGNRSWSNSGSNPVRLGTVAPLERRSRFDPGTWVGPSRAANLSEATVAPGQIGTFEFPIVVPSGAGSFNERLNLVAENATWLNDLGLSYFTHVDQAYSWSLVSQYAYTNQTKSAPADLANLTPGQSVFIGFTARNTGASTWFNTGLYPVGVATAHPTDRLSLFAGAGWLSPARPAHLVEAAVPPGGVGTFEFTYTAPSTKGVYTEYFRPVTEYITHMNDTGMYFYTAVK